MKVISKFEYEASSLQALIEEAVDWFDEICKDERYSTWVVATDHYPFGIDCPKTYLITRDTIKCFDADWDLWKYNSNDPTEFIPVDYVFGYADNNKGIPIVVRYVCQKYPEAHNETSAIPLMETFFNIKDSCIDIYEISPGQDFKNFVYKTLACHEDLVVERSDDHSDITFMCRRCNGIDCYECKRDKTVDDYDGSDDNKVDDDDLIGLNLYLIGRK